MERLRQLLKAIDHKGYKQYKQLEGSYRFPSYRLDIDHVQGDPFALATRISIHIEQNQAGFPANLYASAIRRIGLQDYLARCIDRAITHHGQGLRGSGNSGEIAIACGGPQVLPRNAVLVDGHTVEARLTLGLPADGRTILGQVASSMLLQELPLIVEHALFYHRLDPMRVDTHVDSIEDQDSLRAQLAAHGLVAFIADGAMLARRSGIDDRPLQHESHDILSPPSLRHEITLPHTGDISGMGIPAGVTLIVGGGFHGKSTLLRALERGVYNHIPGDGRERVVTQADAVKIRAEDGRSVACLDISPFINHLPFARSTAPFSSDNASGSTSQAANIIEALHCGSKLLLIDEDTAASNFMIRDARMQSLVSDECEPITPFLHRVRELYEQYGVSSIIVMGGSGDYFDVADNVIMLHNYQPRDVSAEAKQLAKTMRPNTGASLPAFALHAARRPGDLSAKRAGRSDKIDAYPRRLLRYGDYEIDLSKLEQLVDRDQLRTIGWMLRYYSQQLQQQADMIAALNGILSLAHNEGLDRFSPYKVGNLALPRLYELAGAINRTRGLTWDRDATAAQ